ncbi:MAG TPA: hypothetical protein VE404_02755 [Verrucomicrobiae bacterium]|nr:hypothetical protein [Verrucomicrobiae bacterium]
MITGYNTDVKHDGKVYHVQTEDKGTQNPVIETLIYVGGGQIIASKQYNYATLISGGKCDERAVSDLLESQHRRMMRWVSGGKYDANGPPPFGHTIVSARSFDEVVLEFLKSQEGTDPIEIVVEEFLAAPGKPASIRLLVRNGATEAPVPAAQVAITFSPATGKPAKALAGASGADGRLAGKLTLPGGVPGTLLVEARLGAQLVSVEIPVEPS